MRWKRDLLCDHLPNSDHHANLGTLFSLYRQRRRRRRRVLQYRAFIFLLFTQQLIFCANFFFPFAKMFDFVDDVFEQKRRRKNGTGKEGRCGSEKVSNQTGNKQNQLDEREREIKQKSIIL